MRTLALVIPILAFTPACMDTHSVPPPRKPRPETKIDVGPIVDDSGVDVGPVVAERIRERRLGDAHYTSTAGPNPFVSGKIRVEKGESGMSGTMTGGVFCLSVGIMGAVGGGTMFGIGSGVHGAEFLQTPGAALLVVGGIAIAGAVALFLQPSRYREGTVVADLDVKRGQSTTPITAKDDALIHHSVKKDEEAGEPILDGVVNAIGKEANK